MWTLISGIDLKRTRRQAGHVAVTTLVVVATATDAALGLFAKSAQAAAVASDFSAASANIAISAPAAPSVPAIASATPLSLSL